MLNGYSDVTVLALPPASPLIAVRVCRTIIGANQVTGCQSQRILFSGEPRGVWGERPMKQPSRSDTFLPANRVTQSCLPEPPQDLARAEAKALLSRSEAAWVNQSNSVWILSRIGRVKP
jgi:hypothetical protein